MCPLRRKRGFKSLHPPPFGRTESYHVRLPRYGEPQRYVRFALAPATRINQVQVTPMLESPTTSHFARIPPNARDDVGSAELYDASSKPVQDWAEAKIR